MIEKTEVPDLYKIDQGTFAYKNKQTDIQDYLKRKNAFEKQEIEMQQLKTKINNVDNELSSIKSLLQLIIQKVDK